MSDKQDKAAPAVASSVLLAVGCILSFVTLGNPPKMICRVSDQAAQTLQRIAPQLLNRLPAKAGCVILIQH